MEVGVNFANALRLGFPNQSGNTVMPRRIMLSVFASQSPACMRAHADLATQSRMGAIFAEPAEVRPLAYRSEEYPAPIIPTICCQIRVEPGNYYYGSSWSYTIPAPYYGGPIIPTVPPAYVCGL